MNQVEFLLPGHTFIIAEAGVNHNGDVAQAHRLIDIAADAGADAVKFQTWRAEGLATPQAPKAAYQIETTGPGGNQLDMLRSLELSEECHPALIEHCARRRITFLSTAHDWDAIDILDRFDVPAYKVGSGDLTNIPFLRRMAAKRRPIILSTGMGNLAEVEAAVDAIRSQGNERVILLHCVTSYPATFEDCNLRAMLTLEQAFGCAVGYSDHTPGLEAALAAVALGARVIEKHFTLDRSLPGPDHQSSLEPKELRELVLGVRRVEAALGDGVKRPKEVEREVMAVARKSIVAAKDIPAGAVVTEDMLTTKRPGSGILPRYWDSLIGLTATVAIPRDSLLRWEQITWKTKEGQG